MDVIKKEKRVKESAATDSFCGFGCIQGNEIITVMKYFRMGRCARGSYLSYDFQFDFDRPFKGKGGDDVNAARVGPTRYPPALVTCSLQSRFQGKMFTITEIEDLR